MVTDRAERGHARRENKERFQHFLAKNSVENAETDEAEPGKDKASEPNATLSKVAK